MSSDVRASSKAATRELASVDSAAGRVVSELLPLVLAELPALLDAVAGPMSRLEPTVGAALREARAEALSAAEAAVGLVIAETEARLRDLPRPRRCARPTHAPARPAGGAGTASPR